MFILGTVWLSNWTTIQSLFLLLLNISWMVMKIFLNVTAGMICVWCLLTIMIWPSWYHISTIKSSYYHHHIIIKSSYLVWYSATRKPSVNVTAGMWDGVLAWITANEYLDELGDGDGGDDHDGDDHDGDDYVHDHDKHLHHDSRQDLWLVRKQNFLQKSRLESDWITRAELVFTHFVYLNI